MSNKMHRRSIVIIVAVIAVIAIVGSTLAWFVTQSSLSQNFSISGFTAGADVYFLQNGNKAKADSYKDSDGLYKLSLNKDDVNYVGNLRVDVTMKGARARLRVKLNMEWTNSEGDIAQYTSAIPFKFADNWYDNRGIDYCVYYQATDMSGKTDFQSTALINGFDGSSFDTSGFEDGTSVRMAIQVDAVQVNRYTQIWGIDKLPWE